MSKKIGRPKKVLTDKEKESLKYMALIHCTGEEIAGVLQMDYDTLNRICKEDFGMPISEYLKENCDIGKMSLRRVQWKSAEAGNTTMQIWLGKQWLGQTEKVESSVNLKTVDNEVIEEVEKLVESEDDDEGTGR